jgi:hypothetical protein
MTTVPVLASIKCESKRNKWLLDSIGILGTCACDYYLLTLKCSLLKYINVLVFVSCKWKESLLT